jgi:hypothetical protein
VLLDALLQPRCGRSKVAGRHVIVEVKHWGSELLIVTNLRPQYRRPVHFTEAVQNAGEASGHPEVRRDQAEDSLGVRPRLVQTPLNNVVGAEPPHDDPEVVVQFQQLQALRLTSGIAPRHQHLCAKQEQQRVQRIFLERERHLTRRFVVLPDRDEIPAGIGIPHER